MTPDSEVEEPQFFTIQHIGLSKELASTLVAVGDELTFCVRLGDDGPEWALIEHKPVPLQQDPKDHSRIVYTREMYQRDRKRREH